MRAARIAVGGWAALVMAAGAAGPPREWASRGLGGGGGLFAPAFNPHDPDELYIGCDMSQWFRSTNGGASWETVRFTDLQSGNFNIPVQFTPDPLERFAVDFRPTDFWAQPNLARSGDGGLSWATLSGAPTARETWGLSVDPSTTGRYVVSSYSTVYFTRDGGASFSTVTAAYETALAGAFFDEDTLYVATSRGLLVSTNNGGRFDAAPYPGLPADESMVTFSGARAGGRTRLYAVTLDYAWPGMQGNSRDRYRGVYTLDPAPGAVWVPSTNGILAGDRLFFVAACPANAQIAYAAGGRTWPGVPVVYKTTDGGAHWSNILHTVFNENIETGWAGFDGDTTWWYNGFALGLAVAPGDPDRVLFTDLGFVHISTNGGDRWRQAYVRPEFTHPAGDRTPTRRHYRGNGLENTTCWWIEWADSNTLMACFSDKTAIRSTNAGAAWSMDYENLSTGAINTAYAVLRHPTADVLYAAVSSMHDLFQDTHLLSSDEALTNAYGGIRFSTDRGATWQTLEEFAAPATALAFDPAAPDTLFAATACPLDGGLFVCTNLHRGADAAWTRLADPPRARGQAQSIHALADGVLVCTFSGYLTNGSFAPCSGVFVSADRGATWEDRSHTNMLYWTRSLEVDPHDPGENTWYAGVYSGWGGAANDRGGVYVTTNRGLAWARWSDPVTFHRVESVTVHPLDPDTLYVATEVQGLWASTNRRAGGASLRPVEGYPFRHPTRVFFNPHDPAEIWVASFGNGLRVGRETHWRWITLTAEGPGRLSLTSGWYAAGAPLTLAAVPDVYHHFGGWAGDVEPARTNDNPLSFNVTGAAALRGSFHPDLAARGTPHAWLAAHGWTEDFDAAEWTDTDGDGLAAWQEYPIGTSPTNAHTDGDPFDDGIEQSSGADPLRDDSATYAAILAHPHRFGLFTSNSVGDLALGAVWIDTEGGQVRLALGVKAAYSLTGAWTNVGPVAEWTWPAPEEKRFFRLYGAPAGLP